MGQDGVPARCPEVGFEEIAIDLLQARFWMTSGLPTIRKLAWFAGEAGFYDESVMKTFTVTEWVNRLFNGLQARASIWLNQVALREAPD